MSQPDLELRTVPHGGADYDALVALRDDLLRRPLGLGFTAEQLAAEADQLHLGAWSAEGPVGCVVLVPRPDGSMKLRQMAVRPALQGQGIGRRLMRYAEQVARDHGAGRMDLSARETAVPFYERLGYIVQGARYVEVTLPHFLMSRPL